MSTPRTHNEHRILDQRRLKLALGITFVILLTEAIGGFATGSLALLSDAGHMFTDSVSLLLGFIALRIGSSPRNDTYTFGLRRVEIVAALVNGILLLLACASIGYEAVLRILHPKPVDVPWMIAIAIIGLVSNATSAAILRRSSNLTVRSAFLHVFADLLSSIGVVVGGIIMLLWNVPWIDPSLSIMIAAVVLFSSARVIREATNVLLEAAPSDLPVGSIRDALLRLPDVTDVHDLHVWTITSGMYALSCHVRFTATERTHDQMLIDVNALLRDRFGISHATIQIEAPSFVSTEGECLMCLD